MFGEEDYQPLNNKKLKMKNINEIIKELTENLRVIYIYNCNLEY